LLPIRAVNSLDYQVRINFRFVSFFGGWYVSYILEKFATLFVKRVWGSDCRKIFIIKAMVLLELSVLLLFRQIYEKKLLVMILLESGQLWQDRQTCENFMRPEIKLETSPTH
jgi:hypothetical protein